MAVFYSKHNQCGPSCGCSSCSTRRGSRGLLGNTFDRDVYIRYLEERLQRLELIVAANTQRINEMEEGETP